MKQNEMQAMARAMRQAGFTAEEVAKAIMGMSVSAPTPEKTLVEFVKADGTKVMCTPAQAEAWKKWRDGAPERKEAFEKMRTEWADKRSAYKPSKALTDAIKANRAAITHKVARDQYGFVGTKQDLKDLKERICK